MFKKVCASMALGVTLVLAGCQATTLNPGAEKILLSPNPPPKGCKYVGEVTGNQGNFVSGGFTSNKNLEQGSMNSLKNQALALGANYVQMLSNRAGVSGSGLTLGSGNGGQQQTNVVYTGNAYKCPKLD